MFSKVVWPCKGQQVKVTHLFVTTYSTDHYSDYCVQLCITYCKNYFSHLIFCMLPTMTVSSQIKTPCKNLHFHRKMWEYLKHGNFFHVVNYFRIRTVRNFQDAINKERDYNLGPKKNDDQCVMFLYAHFVYNNEEDIKGISIAFKVWTCSQTSCSDSSWGKWNSKI